MPLSGRANVMLGESHRLELGGWAQLSWEPASPGGTLIPRYLAIGLAYRVTGCRF